MVFLDETGFFLLPLRRKTWALRGHTPVLVHRAHQRDKVSVAAALAFRSPQEPLRLFYGTYPDAYITAPRMAAFLRRMLTRLDGPVLVVWDRGNCHRGDAIRQVLLEQRRLQVYILPPYAPELNPVEYAWTHAKHERLANFAPKTIGELQVQAVSALRADQRSQKRLRSFFLASPLFTGGRHYLWRAQ